jgi:L-histidine Nalpha-methyltransferase
MSAHLATPPAVCEHGPPTARFRADVLRGLAGPHKEIPWKYLYDEAGSALFERICTLPEYYLTRTELALMQRHAGEMAELLGPACLLIEYGSGSGAKTRLLLDRLAAPAAYVPIDISGEPLAQTAEALAYRYPTLEVLPVWADFTRPFVLPVSAVGARRRTVYFPGSTIGNLAPDDAIDLLRRTAHLCAPRGGLLLGADLKKDPAALHAAYNDAQGVTAAFNLNLLTRINRELGGDFRTHQFWHHALYNPKEGRIEMHLVSRLDQRVHIGGEVFAFAEGESIRTEHSYKHSLSELRRLAAAAGFEARQVWCDPAKTFAVAYYATA